MLLNTYTQTLRIEKVFLRLPNVPQIAYSFCLHFSVYLCKHTLYFSNYNIGPASLPSHAYTRAHTRRHIKTHNKMCQLKAYFGRFSKFVQNRIGDTCFISGSISIETPSFSARIYRPFRQKENFPYRYCYSANLLMCHRTK